MNIRWQLPAFSPGALAEAALNLVLPPRCIACRTEVRTNGDICKKCWSAVRFIADPMCKVCGLPLGGEAADADHCAECFDGPRPFGRMRSVMAYDQRSRSMILALKHHERLEGVPLFGQWIAAAGKTVLRDAELIVPMPIHRFRLLRRGFNQSVELARAVSDLAGRPMMIDGFRKIESTRSQVGLDAAARAQNVQEKSFLVTETARRRIAGRNLVLIDDVYTTGTTVAACCAVLQDAGAKKVDILTLARVVNGERDAI